MNTEIINRAVMDYYRESRMAGVACTVVPVCFCNATSTTDPTGYDMPLLRMYKAVFHAAETDADLIDLMNALCCLFTKMGLTAPTPGGGGGGGGGTPGIGIPPKPELPVPPVLKDGGGTGGGGGGGAKVDVPYACLNYFISDVCSPEAVSQFKAISVMLALVGKLYPEVNKLKDVLDAIIAICTGKDGKVVLDNAMIASICAQIKAIPDTLPGIGKWSEGLSIADDIVEMLGVDGAESVKGDSMTLGKILQLAKTCCGG